MPAADLSARRTAPVPDADQALLAQVRRAHAQLDAIGVVGQADALLSGDVGKASRLITETAARVSGCERVNVWLFDDAETELRCIDLFEATPGRHSAGMVLRESEYRVEFQAIKQARYVNADDPLADPRTAGYVESYLKPLGITSMLDAAIHASGRNFGLLCFEHVGRPHHWEEDEIAFACQLADKLALALVNRTRRLAEARLRESETRYRQLVEATTDYIWEVDADGVFTFVAPRMTSLLGWREGDSIEVVLRAGVPEDASPILSQFSEWKSNPRSYEMVETAARTLDGRRVVFETSSVPVFDDAGAFLGHRGISRDVTARVQAAQELAYRDDVRQALAATLTEMAGGHPLADMLPRALGLIGGAVDAQEIAVCQAAAPGGPLRPAFEWRAAGSVRALPTAGCVVDPSEGEPERNADAVVRVPIATEGVVWGYLRVRRYSERRSWHGTEIDSFRIIADVIGGLITRETARLALARSEAMFRTVTEAAQDAIVMLDTTGAVRFWNGSAERIFGYTAAEAVGRNLHQWLAPGGFREKAEIGMRAFARSAEGPILGRIVEVAAIRRDGAEVPLELSVAPMMLGEDRFAVGILRDISERKRTEAEILRMARFDGLTGLANRGLFAEALQQAIARVRRGERGFAVLYLDLDHFKDVNDTLGHPVGDRLLQAVAERLRSCGRQTDTIARFGGDEFAILQSDIEDATSAGLLAGKLVTLLGEPFSLDGNEVRTAASIGIAVYSDADPGAETLLGHADIALYKAKSEGRGTFRFFTDAMDVDVRTRVRLSDELRHALASNELFLVYQPQVDIATGRIVGLEALVRWHHPERGVIGPATFVPVAERSGLVVTLGEWVLRSACRQTRLWLDEGIAPDVVAINVSPLQFKAPQELERSIIQALEHSGVPPERLELELTETALMEASRDHNALLARLRGRRLRLSIDDFGTGYSSLDYLRKFPVDRIKLAQTFISGIAAINGDAAIVKAALGLARELGLGVIAEGLETSEQRDLLSTWGCVHAQGNYFSKPVTAEEMTALLRHGFTTQT